MKMKIIFSIVPFAISSLCMGELIAQYDLDAREALDATNVSANLLSASDFTPGAFQIAGNDAAVVSFAGFNGYGPDIINGTGSGFTGRPGSYAEGLSAGYTYTFTLTANPGYQINLESLYFDTEIASGGMNAYSVDLNADGNGFETALAGDNNLGDDPFTLTISSSLVDPLDYQGISTLDVRIVHFRSFGSTGNDGPRSGFEDVQVFGTVAIPEPSSFAVIVLATSVGIMVHRKRRN